MAEASRSNLADFSSWRQESIRIRRVFSLSCSDLIQIGEIWIVMIQILPIWEKSCHHDVVVSLIQSMQAMGQSNLAR
jgi:hypothetical protein